MAKQKEVKTNAMRILETMKIPFVHYTYECDEFVDGLQIADKLSLPYEKVYKTLVTVDASKNYYVFVIPVAKELDIKELPTMIVSGGKIGVQLELKPDDLKKAARAEYADVLFY